MNVKINDYNELSLLLNESNLYYWNKLPDSSKQLFYDDICKYFDSIEQLLPSVVELNITVRFMINESYKSFSI